MSVNPGVSSMEAEAAALAQRRLLDLLRANATIVERLDLEIVLRRIVEAAMGLVDADYGALGVLAADGRGLERFIHVGVDTTTAQDIGSLTKGEGLLGAVITDGVPIRLEHVGDDSRSAETPLHHPPMDAFLGVPVCVGDQVYGNLYLTRGTRGPFSADDEDLIVALAATAGIAIENARLYDAAQARELWSATTADVMAAMLGLSGESVLDVIAEHVGSLIEVDLVVVAVPHGDDELRVTTVHGSGAEALRGRVFPAAGSLAARAVATQRAASAIGEADQDPVDWQPGSGPTVAIPLYRGEELLGVLTMSRPLGAHPFSDADVDMAFAFAGQAGVAIEIVRAREDRRRLAASRDRGRIARDLHDHAIQRLFAAGLGLQAISATADADASAAIEAQVDAIDAAIKDIRTVVLALGAGEWGSRNGTRDRLLDVVTELAGGLASTPRITFTGPLDSLVHRSLADELVAVLRECLTNSIRHADARSLEVTVGIAEGTVTLCVQDDGPGIPPDAPYRGLANLIERAHRRGGRCVIGATDGRGTSIEWSVPADSPIGPHP